MAEHNYAPAIRQRLRLSGCTELSFITAGEASKPALLLLHGTPNSARMFREITPALAQTAHVIAPDLPGCGESDALPAVSFPAIGQAIAELLDRLAIGPRFIYLHDWGAPVGMQIAMQAPERVLGLIVQNANAHRTGWGPGWAAQQAYWSQPNAENEAAVTAHLTFDGTRDTYISGVPSDVAERIPAERWQEDWRVMNLPGRMQTQRALIADYAHYAARFDAIAEYLERWQPPALMVWGRHDVYFDLAEVLSWMRALPRMEAHVLDAGHLLLETHATAAVSLMLDFIRRTQGTSRRPNAGGLRYRFGDRPVRQHPGADAQPSPSANARKRSEAIRAEKLANLRSFVSSRDRRAALKALSRTCDLNQRSTTSPIS